ncbi:hypothetical protein DP107_04330 [Haloglomus irregulare]|jgi:hypothetical protein|uniref:Uncharacterized protein n=1 Tax=Haloglomus irregulare TaxID=2234134 RepID=A0A554NCG4_9EURY|nr:hypothetical protein [Haloglomus irregulare]TSD15087.1 hypothetical protein DP107_04330 [Haloglomus irregulare]
MIDCECGATLAPAVIIRDDVGDRHRCPECRRFWECCPSCFEWFRPFRAAFDRPEPRDGCPFCELTASQKAALRLPNDSPRGRTLRALRADDTVAAFGPSEPGVAIDESGEVVADD